MADVLGILTELDISNSLASMDGHHNGVQSNSLVVSLRLTTRISNLQMLRTSEIGGSESISYLQE